MTAVAEQTETKRARTSNVDFIKAYNSCNSVAEVAAKLGITENSVTQRRLSLQKVAKAQGLTIPFKKFPRATSKERTKGLSAEQIAELSQLAESLLSPESAS